MIPSELKRVYTWSFHKKENNHDCTNYRIISVVLYTQFEKWAVQSGFKQGKFLMDTVFCIKLLIEKSIAYGNQPHFVYIN